VRGAYDPERDLQALRMRAARRDIARAAGVEGSIVNIDHAAAQTLARERAEAVRAALLAHGIDPARVRIGDAVERQAAEKGIATGLTLAAGLSSDAAAGASQSPRQAADDPVREVQRRLNAAGYDAGPVDGILGPRTKRALIHYQAVQGLELTGELDAATLERLGV
jgi:hypothetical protein